MMMMIQNIRKSRHHSKKNCDNSVKCFNYSDDGGCGGGVNIINGHNLDNTENFCFNSTGRKNRKNGIVPLNKTSLLSSNVKIATGHNHSSIDSNGQPINSDVINGLNNDRAIPKNIDQTIVPKIFDPLLLSSASSLSSLSSINTSSDGGVESVLDHHCVSSATSDGEQVDHCPALSTTTTVQRKQSKISSSIKPTSGNQEELISSYHSTPPSPPPPPSCSTTSSSSSSSSSSLLVGEGSRRANSFNTNNQNLRQRRPEKTTKIFVDDDDQDQLVSNSNSGSKAYSNLLRYRSQEFFTKLVNNGQNQWQSSDDHSQIAQKLNNQCNSINQNSGSKLSSSSNSPRSSLSGIVQRITKEFESLHDLSTDPKHQQPKYCSTVIGGHHRQKPVSVNGTIGNYYPISYHHPHYFNHSSSLLRSNSSLSLVGQYQRNNSNQQQKNFDGDGLGLPKISYNHHYRNRYLNDTTSSYLFSAISSNNLPISTSSSSLCSSISLSCASLQRCPKPQQQPKKNSPPAKPTPKFLLAKNHSAQFVIRSTEQWSSNSISPGQTITEPIAKKSNNTLVNSHYLISSAPKTFVSNGCGLVTENQMSRSYMGPPPPPLQNQSPPGSTTVSSTVLTTSATATTAKSNSRHLTRSSSSILEGSVGIFSASTAGAAQPSIGYHQMTNLTGRQAIYGGHPQHFVSTNTSQHYSSMNNNGSHSVPHSMEHHAYQMMNGGQAYQIGHLISPPPSSSATASSSSSSPSKPLIVQQKSLNGLSFTSTAATTLRLPQRFPTTAATASATTTKMPNEQSPVKVQFIKPPPLPSSSSTSSSMNHNNSIHLNYYSTTNPMTTTTMTSNISTTTTTTTTTAAGSMMLANQESLNPMNNIRHHQFYQDQGPMVQRNFLNNSGNIFDSKKNKLSGSVSSIDLQCLKESQKVSVVERKSSKLGSRTVKCSNSTSSNSSGGAASSFFKLFTSSTKAKIPFGFSNSNSSSGAVPQTSTSSSVLPAGSGSSSASSSSATTITTRSDLFHDGENDPTKRYHLDHVSATAQQQRLTIKSISVDSASTNGCISSSGSTASTLIEPIMPANEILFRKYFTFYDLLSSTNFHRLFDRNTVFNSTTPPATTANSSTSSSSSSPGATTCSKHQKSNRQTNQSIAHQSSAPTTFESSTLSSTSSYSSCASSMSSSSHYNSLNKTLTNNAVVVHQQQFANNGVLSSPSTATVTAAALASDVGNDLLSPSPNFLNEIGSERQYSIELRWNNGFKEEIPLQMLNQTRREHERDQATSMLANDIMNGAHQSVSQRLLRNSMHGDYWPNSSNQTHTPSYVKRINIFSEASPFAALSQHSVMSDLYGSNNGTNGSNFSTLNHHQHHTSKKSDIDFNDLDDGFGSLSSTSLGSTYPLSLNGTSLLSSPSSVRCPFSAAAETCNVLEMDYGTSFYRTHFYATEHQNWLQIHEKYGPIVISLRKERIKTSNSSTNSNSTTGSSSSLSSSSNSSSNSSGIRWRVIVRTTSLIPLRGTVSPLPSICIPCGVNGSSSLDPKRSNLSADSLNINSVRDVLTLVMPKSVNVSNFRLASPTATPILLKLDEISQNTEYKIGVLFAHGSQHSEEEFYNNILDYSSNTSKSPFYEFLSLIAQRVRLKDFKGYKAGLDVINDTTGEYSWTAKFGHVDIMFHVCTELPFTKSNKQQLPRKRHIGNDIVTLVFLNESFSGPSFTPALIRSKFQQVFIVIKPVQNGKYYRVSVARHKMVPLFGPPLKPHYSKSELREFLLTKIINAENACLSINKFAEMAKRTRNEYLTELCNKHSLTQNVNHVDSSLTSNSLNSFKNFFSKNSNGLGNGSDSSYSKRNKDSSITITENGHFRPTNGQQLPLGRHVLNGIKDPPTLMGAIMFSERCNGSALPSRLYVHDFSTSRDIQVQLLLSNEAVLVIDAATSEVVWAAPVTSIIGWTDSSGVFATSPTTNSIQNLAFAQEKSSNGNGVSGKFGDKRAKSMDCDVPNLMNKNSCRELRLYYHQGECIQIMQRPIIPNAQIVENGVSTNGKFSKNHVTVSSNRNDDPFLMLIRVLELITRKSELREIVIKRKSPGLSKSATTTPEHQRALISSRSSPSSLPFDQSSCCGGNFGFSMNTTTGIIEEIFDPALADYHLEPGFKVCEIAKISFAAMASDELQELLNSSVIICLTFTAYDFVRFLPRCSCPWPQTLQLKHRQKCQYTPPSEYENLPLLPKNIVVSEASSVQMAQQSTQSTKQSSNSIVIQQQPSNVQKIQITHSSDPHHYQTIMNVSSTSSSNSSYYSTNTANSNQSTPIFSNSNFTGNNNNNQAQSLYGAKSTSNINQLYQSPVKIHDTTYSNLSQSANTSPLTNSTNGGNRSRSTTIANGHAITTQPSTFKDNLIKLITMDDFSPNKSVENDIRMLNDDTTTISFNKNGISLPLLNQNQIPAAYATVGHFNCQPMKVQQHQPLQTTPQHFRYNHHHALTSVPYEDMYSSYPSSRYSTASSAQFSSLGRNGSLAAQQQQQQNSVQHSLHSVNTNNTTVPIISGHQMIRTGPYGKESTANVIPIENGNECYLLTAQPVRVESTTSTTVTNVGNNSQMVSSSIESQPQQLAGWNAGLNLVMTSSYDSTMNRSKNVIATLLDNSAAPTEIVWPSTMHNSIDGGEHQSFVQSVDNEAPKEEVHDPSKHLTEKVRKLAFEKNVLNDTISKLREENQRLHIESQTASQQLRKLTEWFFNNSGPSSTVSSNSSSNNGPASSTVSNPANNQSMTTTAGSIQMTATTATITSSSSSTASMSESNSQSNNV